MNVYNYYKTTTFHSFNREIEKLQQQKCESALFK
jgi:hypothetical protein